MHFFKRFCFLLSLSFCLAPSLLSAQQLSQPASVLPWQATQAEVELALKGPASSSESDSPAWLIDTAKPLAKQPRTQKNLPSVDKESYANLGQLNNNSATQKTRSNQRNRSSSAKSGKSFSLLRALGIKANRSGRR